MVTCMKECGVEQPDYILDGAGFGDGRENIAGGLNTFDDTVFYTVFYCCACCAR